MSDLIPLKDICERLGVNPRAARLKLRASGVTIKGFRWEFSKSDAKRVEALLAGDAPKASAAAKAPTKENVEAQGD
jgi:hypothetical protein